MNSRLDKNKNIRKKIDEEEKTKKKKKAKRRLRKVLIILLIVLGLLLLYSRFIEPNMLFVNEYKINSKTIENNFNGLKIVQFSDLHYGSTIKEKQLKKIINKINTINPDIVIFTGDLIEENYKISEKEEKLLISYLKKIESKYGNYAITGNHDYYNDDFNNIIFDSNFILLNNSYDIIYSYNNESIGIFGLDNYTYGNPDMNKFSEKEFSDLKYKILLVHEPDYIDKIKSDNKIDLILSGHSHNQQVRIPYLKGFWLPKGSKTYYEPHYKINDTEVYISNGLGTSLLKFRFLSPPSINFFRITKNK